MTEIAAKSVAPPAIWTVRCTRPSMGVIRRFADSNHKLPSLKHGEVTLVNATTQYRTPTHRRAPEQTIGLFRLVLSHKRQRPVGDGKYHFLQVYGRLGWHALCWSWCTRAASLHVDFRAQSSRVKSQHPEACKSTFDYTCR